MMLRALSKMPPLPLRSVRRKHPTAFFPRRLNSSQPQSEAVPKEVSPHIGFYQVFGRPIAKVLLMATFTYQLSYWLWVKLEKDEIKSERMAEISELETRLHALVDTERAP